MTKNSIRQKIAEYELLKAMLDDIAALMNKWPILKEQFEPFIRDFEKLKRQMDPVIAGMKDQ